MDISKHVINAKIEIDGETLTQGIKYHGETRKDDIACKKIDSLKGLLSEVMIELYKVKEDASQHDTASSRNILKEIDDLHELMRDFID